MSDNSQIGILFVEEGSGEKIGIIKFDSSGLLVYQIMIPGTHPYGFKNIETRLKEGPIKEPLYLKHAKLMNESSKLPEEVLIREAKACADYLNSLDHPIHINKYCVKANAIRFDQLK
jgi:hypothetical protein